MMWISHSDCILTYMLMSLEKVGGAINRSLVSAHFF